MSVLRASILAGTCLASGILIRAVRDFANQRALLDRPNDRSSHSVPKPRLGGVGIVLPLLAVGVGLIVTGRAPVALFVPLGAIGLIAILGLVDDLRPLPARVRFGVQVVLASAVVATSWERLPAAAGILAPALPQVLVAPLAVVWIVWLTNLYNFMDGIDGIAGCQALVASLGLFVVATGVGAETTAWILLALAGSSAGFLLFNLPPSSIFMGDVGSTAIGFLFGILPLLPEEQMVSVEPVALALSFFVLDATFTLLRRLAKGERWYVPHRTHLYQRPIVLGFGHRPVLLVAVGAMFLAAGGAVAWNSAGKWGKVMLTTVPVLLYGAGQIIVARIPSRSSAGAPADT